MVHYIDISITKQRRIFIAAAAAELVRPHARQDEIPLRISLFFNII